jgi:ubiquinone/menaquinone biosynthesis C-methylase UbiE
MGRLLNVVTPLHQKTKRDHLERMKDEKVHCMRKAREFDFDFWDGDRRYGYGGHTYIQDYWKPVAEVLIKEYGLTDESRILDVGCGKAYLLYEIRRILPKIEVFGFDISEYAIENAKEELRDSLFLYKAQNRYPWGDNYFDLVLSFATLHNLRIYELQTALQEIERVGKHKYIMMDSYRNEKELFGLQCWALTCETFMDTAEWIWLFQYFGYTGDYEFIFFE